MRSCPTTAKGAAQAAGQVISLTVGTAGHIDHGKTQLVRMLTGCDTDRLPEEKARGMTIDLGFAACVLPSNRRVGIVDVPGHERFIHNMVAGAAGMDAVLLVVAADDGVMPQTVEHLQIINLLGVTAGMTAITKIDLVPPERVAEVADQVRALAAGSFLAQAPIVPVSSKTGAGYDAFYEAFTALVDRTAERDAGGPFRLNVERSFVLEGIGTVVSGIPRSGTVRTGDELELLPAGALKRVRGIQVYGQSAGQGRAGECVALRLADMRRDEAGRGAVLAAPGHFRPSRFLSARFRLLSSVGDPIRPRTAVRLHLGTSDVPGHLVLPELTSLPPGGESYVQIQLQAPVVAALGDPFVVRMLSPVRTIGGGYVVAADAEKMRRARGDWAQERAERDAAFRDPATALAYVLEHAGCAPLRVAELSRRAVLTEDAAAARLRELVEAGKAAALPGERFVAAEALTAASKAIADRLSALHDASPLAVGFAKKAVVADVEMDRALLDRAIEGLARDGRVQVTDAGLRLAERAAKLNPAQAALAARIVARLAETGFHTPRSDELPGVVGAPASLVTPVLEHLVQSGTVVRVDERILLHRDAADDAGKRIARHIRAHGAIDAGGCKELLDTTRKYAIPILEYFDARGLTRRVGDKRVLREEPKQTDSV